MQSNVNKKTITISDVALAAQVSRTTVSHALNGKGEVNPDTRKKIQEIAEQLGYRPNRFAKALRSGGTKTIALISTIPSAISGGASKLGFMMEVANVAAIYALEHDLYILLVPFIDHNNFDGNLMNVDGVILLEPCLNDPIVKKLVQYKIPLVCIGTPGQDNKEVPYVDLQSEQTAIKLLEHLVEEGAHQIALITGQSKRNASLKAEEIYSQYCQQYAMTEVVYKVEEHLGEMGGKSAIAEIMKQYPKTDAILVMIDTFATGVMQYLTEKGISVPKQMKVVTRYNGIRALTSNPPLTAVDLHLDDVAKIAIDLLITQLNEDIETGSLRVMPAPEIIKRTSSVQISSSN